MINKEGDREKRRQRHKREGVKGSKLERQTKGEYREKERKKKNFRCEYCETQVVIHGRSKKGVGE